MYKLKNGSLRTVIYNVADLELYKQAGWTLVEEKSEKEKPLKKEETNEQSNSKGKSNKK